MGNRNLNIISILFGVCVFSIVASVTVFACFVSFVCNGPIKYYEEIGCTPVYDTPVDSRFYSCPIRYNCSVWKNLPLDKCLINGHIYDSGEKLRHEDSYPCDNCYCKGSEGWSCNNSMCAGKFNESLDDALQECYYKHTENQCCPSPTICARERKLRQCDRSIDKLSIAPTCYCDQGASGEDVELFCISQYLKKCSNVMRYGTKHVRANCIPIYDVHKDSNSDCYEPEFRCQEIGDRVIRRNSRNFDNEDPDMMCKFGNMTMQIWDELDPNTYKCVRCVCNLPPVPTCQRLSNEECDWWMKQLENDEKFRDVNT